MGRYPRGSKRISCRLTKLADQKLRKELAKLMPDKLGRPPTGALLSQLIINAEDTDWARAKAKAKLPEKSRRAEPDRKRRAVEKKEAEPKRRSSERELERERENMGWDERVWADEED